MSGKRFSVEQIINHIREAEVLLSQDQTVGEICRRIGGIGAELLSLAPGIRRPEGRPGKTLEGTGEGERPASTGGIRPHARQADPSRGCTGKLLSPARRRAGADHVQSILGVSERRACAVLGQHRSTQRKMPEGRSDGLPANTT